VRYSGSAQRLRVPFAATFVVAVSVLALVGMFARAPEALLGAVFARARAAEAVTMAARHGWRLRVEREDERNDDAQLLRTSVAVTKTVTSERQGHDDGTSLGSLSWQLARPSWPWAIASARRAWPCLPIAPPTRGRARLMVFLN